MFGENPNESWEEKSKQISPQAILWEQKKS